MNTMITTNTTNSYPTSYSHSYSYGYHSYPENSLNCDGIKQCIT